MRRAASSIGIESAKMRPPLNRGESLLLAKSRRLEPAASWPAYSQNQTVRPEGAEHQWRKVPPRELSVDLVPKNYDFTLRLLFFSHTTKSFNHSAHKLRILPVLLFGHVGLIADHTHNLRVFDLGNKGL